MKFGISIPTCREGMDIAPGQVRPSDLITLAKKADELGFDTAWGNDHLTPSNRIRSLYKTMPSFYEIMITLTYCAAVTKRMKMATGVIVTPFRDPILLAKQTATLDVLSGGRFILGIGMGNNREEFQMLYPRISNSHRGHMLDEALESLTLLLTQPSASYKGEYYEFNDVVLEPKPLQKPFPIYMSGHSPNTIDRTVKYCSGLMAYSPDVEDLRRQTAQLKAAATAHGRNPDEIDFVVSTTLSIAPTREEAIKRFLTSHTGKRAGVSQDINTVTSRNLIGSPEDIIARIAKWQEAGLKHCAVPGIAADTFKERIEQLEMFASEVMPKFKRP